MNANCAIKIGSTHSLCQDYAVARNDGPYIVLSDGCSSSPDTDVGSRLLVRGAERVFRTQGGDDVEALHKEAARLALDWAALIGVPAQSVDATLMSAHISGEQLIVACSGDGVIVLEFQNGTVDLYAISNPSGYPFYPCYSWQPERLSELTSNGRTTKEIKHFRREPTGKRFRLLNFTTSDALTEVFRLDACQYRYAAVASDGINSFYRTRRSSNGKRVEDVGLHDVLNEFWSFKNSNGAFVARRLNRFTKDTDVKGWQHADDLSIAVIYLGEEHVRQG